MSRLTFFRSENMPIEETANLLLMTAAIALETGTPSLQTVWIFRIGSSQLTWTNPHTLHVFRSSLFLSSLLASTDAMGKLPCCQFTWSWWTTLYWRFRRGLFFFLFDKFGSFWYLVHTFSFSLKPIPHDANLAAKGIIGIGAYGILCK